LASGFSGSCDHGCQQESVFWVSSNYSQLPREEDEFHWWPGGEGHVGGCVGGCAAGSGVWQWDTTCIRHVTDMRHVPTPQDGQYINTHNTASAHTQPEHDLRDLARRLRPTAHCQLTSTATLTLQLHVRTSLAGPSPLQLHVGTHLYNNMLGPHLYNYMLALTFTTTCWESKSCCLYIQLLCFWKAFAK
jgi:hypothetical protein